MDCVQNFKKENHFGQRPKMQNFQQRDEDLRKFEMCMEQDSDMA